MDPEELEKLIDKKILANNRKLDKKFHTRTSQSELLVVNRQRHQNERRMAWTALITAIVLAFIVFIRVPPELIENYTGYLNAVFIMFGAVIGAYMGFTTWGGNKFFEANSEGGGQVNANIDISATTDQSAG